MKYTELDLMEVPVCSANNIKNAIGLTTEYYPLHSRVEYIYDRGVSAQEFFTEDEMNKILTTLIFKESMLDEEYIDDVEELCTLKSGDDYIMTLYYILEDVDFALIRTIRIHSSEIEKTLRRK